MAPETDITQSRRKQTTKHVKKKKTFSETRNKTQSHYSDPFQKSSKKPKLEAIPFQESAIKPNPRRRNSETNLRSGSDRRRGAKSGRRVLRWCKEEP